MFKLFGLFCNVLPLWAELSLLRWESNKELLGKQGPFSETLKHQRWFFFSLFLKPGGFGFFLSLAELLWICLDEVWKCILSWNHKKRRKKGNRTGKCKTWQHLITREVHKLNHGCQCSVLSFLKAIRLAAAARSHPTAHQWKTRNSSHTETCSFLQPLLPTGRTQWQEQGLAWGSGCTIIYWCILRLRFSEVPQDIWSLEGTKIPISHVQLSKFQP